MTCQSLISDLSGVESPSVATARMHLLRRFSRYGPGKLAVHADGPCVGVGRGNLGSARIARVHAFLLSTHPLTCLEHTGSATTHKNNGQPDVRSRKISIFSRQRPREP